MSRSIRGLSLALACGGLAGAAQAAVILVNGDIAVSTTWTANNTYNLQQQIYVLPGATLTIEPGTVIASTTFLGGSLAVARGGQIFARGTRDEPIIFTSLADVGTWAIDLTHPIGHDPETGVWRQAANEWGNLTIMGRAYISSNSLPGNVPTPNGNNLAPMEGLVGGFPGDPKVLYGGGDDDDDSGSLEYVSLRYGGKVIALNNELNGLSLGGVGRGTLIRNVEVMNNVDDGIELWGGTVDLEYFSIWNVGDDCFDVDQGWRGRGQFGLLVQGCSVNAPQGSGVGDNVFELDGAEACDWQPVTTATIYNCTVLGQPIAGDHGTDWNDNARVQFRNCIFMDLGEELVHQGVGYGCGGTLSWAATWATDSSIFSIPNSPPNPADFYKTQLPGKLAEITDSVFFRNLHALAYTTATAVGVFDPSQNNVLIPGIAPADSPVTNVTRGAAMLCGGLSVLPVIGLDPHPAKQATDSVAWAPGDSGFDSPKYRGAFAPDGMSWLDRWTASTAFGFTPEDPSTKVWCDEENWLDGVAGDPLLSGHGPLTAGSANSLRLIKAAPGAQTALFVSLVEGAAPFKGGILVTVPILLQVNLVTDAGGGIGLPFVWPAGVAPGTPFYFQCAVKDVAVIQDVSLSNAVKGEAQ